MFFGLTGRAQQLRKKNKTTYLRLNMFHSEPGLLVLIDGTINSALQQTILKENIQPSIHDLKL